MSVSIIIPTIPSRAELLQRVKWAYEDSLDGVEHEFIVMHGFYRCGAAWDAGIRKATMEYIHITADDIIPATHSWYRAGVEAVKAGCSPRHILDDPHGHRIAPGGHNAFDPIPGWGDWAECNGTALPFFSKQDAAKILPIPDLHYYSDNWISAKMQSIGIRFVMRTGYHFVHFQDPNGRVDDRGEDDRYWAYLKTQPDIAEWART